MLDRQRTLTTGITAAAAATVALVIWLKPWATDNLAQTPADPIEQQTPTEKPHGRQVDIVFAVDTTGSMGGLLDGAKRTVWSIANQVRDIESNADLHVGLVAYRDLGDAYVTKDFQLSSDLDAVYAELTSYQAGGGGDVPEDVDAALYDAVHKMKWRSGAKKMIFLVGDAPPASRGDVPAFGATAHEAANKQIKINTIRCGQDRETASAWQAIAMIGNGSFSTIQQDGGVQQVATPYDDQMAKLAETVDENTVIYGDASTRHAWAGKMAVNAAAPAAAKADRGAYYAKGGGVAAAPAEDVVGGVATGTVSVDKLEAEKLPEGYQGKSNAEIAADFKDKAAKRASAQKEMNDLSKKRDEWIKTNTKDSGGFDSVVKQTITEELK